MNIYSIFTCLLVFISTALAVSLRDDGTSYILDNDYSTVVIAKKSGYITSLKLKGRNEEFLNRSYIDANGGKVYFSPSSSKVIKNTSSHVEVAFYDNYRSGSKLGLDWEVRYTMLSDTRGVYFSLTNTHKSNYPDTSYSEIRLVLRLKANIFITYKLKIMLLVLCQVLLIKINVLKWVQKKPVNYQMVKLFTNMITQLIC